MTGPDPAWDPRTDQSCLREVQYRTDANLAARQSIYAYQQPRIDLARETLELAGNAARRREPRPCSARLPADPARFPITTHSGCLVCT